MKQPKFIELDGCTGEGGGQLVRNAVCLASVVTQPVRIVNVRGNRMDKARGGGLKAQHVSAIEVLAKATDAEVTGLSVGSRTLEFRPRRGPGPAAIAALASSSSLARGPASEDRDNGTTTSTRKASTSGSGRSRLVRIVAGSAASSAMLIFQAVFPFLLFSSGSNLTNGTDATDKGDEAAGRGTKEGEDEKAPIELEIEGGTNVSWSPSYDYVDQVLCPALETWFGVLIERRLIVRGWNSGPIGRGKIWFKFRPIKPGQALSVPPPATRVLSALKPTDFTIKTIDVTIVTPTTMHTPLTRSITKDLSVLFPDAEVRFLPVEDSGHASRMFLLLVARPGGDSPLIWGRDLLCSGPGKAGGGGRGGGSSGGGRSGKNNHRGKGSNSGSSGSSRGHSNPYTNLSFTEIFSRKVCTALHADIVRRPGSVVDEFLQDQLVIFQGLATGRSSFPRSEHLILPPANFDTWYNGDGTDAAAFKEYDDDGGGLGLEEAIQRLRVSEGDEELRRDRPRGEAFGEGSLHTTTARWVTTELLPDVKWFDGGRVCEGIGMRVVNSN